MKKMPLNDKNLVIKRYSKRYEEHGYSPKTLGWDKGKQDLRYSILFEDFDLTNKSILDIGCGFGDANLTLKSLSKNYTYLGIDIVESLIKEASNRYKNDNNINFLVSDFLESSMTQKYDVVVASGVFNFKLETKDNYAFIFSFMKKAFELAKDGIAFDFLSDKVDFQYDHTFHSNPAKIVDMGYNLTRNLKLKNHYMPFEFSVTLFKNQSFLTSDSIFTRYKNERKNN